MAFLQIALVRSVKRFVQGHQFMNDWPNEFVRIGLVPLKKAQKDLKTDRGRRTRDTRISCGVLRSWFIPSPTAKQVMKRQIPPITMNEMAAISESVRIGKVRMTNVLKQRSEVLPVQVPRSVL